MKPTVIAIIIAVLLIGVAIFLGPGGVPQNDEGSNSGDGGNANNVSIVDGKQIIEIDAKGGYLPRKSIAQAGIPTVIRFNTQATFDCSAAVRIPSLNVSKILPQTGATDIDIGTPEVGPLKGSCGMGMYPFEVQFK